MSGPPPPGCVLAHDPCSPSSLRELVADLAVALASGASCSSGAADRGPGGLLRGVPVVVEHGSPWLSRVVDAGASVMPGVAGGAVSAVATGQVPLAVGPGEPVTASGAARAEVAALLPAGLVAASVDDLALAWSALSAAPDVAVRSTGLDLPRFVLLEAGDELRSALAESGATVELLPVACAGDAPALPREGDGVVVVTPALGGAGIPLPAVVTVSGPGGAVHVIARDELGALRAALWVERAS